MQKLNYQIEMPDDFYQFPDRDGRFGPYGGSYVAETLMAPLAELKQAYLSLRDDATFQSEMQRDLWHYVGRPSPIYFAERLSKQIGGARILFKREDLNHTGAMRVS